METIDEYEGQYITVMDVPNTFIHTKISPNKYGEERVVMNTTGVIVDMLLEMDSDTYSNHVVFENERKLIYVVF